jgi:hypothetical protein
MKTGWKIVLLCLSLCLFTGCLWFAIRNINQQIITDIPPAMATTQSTPSEGQSSVVQKLQRAPWQGLRYIREDNIWRFYGVAGESRQIDWVYPMTVRKIFYLLPDQHLTHTWVLEDVRFPEEEKDNQSTQALRVGNLVAVQLSGSYVTQDGVDWQACGTKFCKLADQLDHILVLDDQGTGISNGFIRYGWLPPLYPDYGILCWQLIPQDDIVKKSLQS